MRSINKIACQNKHNLAKETLIGMFYQNQKVLDFLNRADWEILSFDPVSREACISVKNKTGATIISLTAPVYY